MNRRRRSAPCGSEPCSVLVGRAIFVEVVDAAIAQRLAVVAALTKKADNAPRPNRQSVLKKH